jgi:hypothetical protein
MIIHNLIFYNRSRCPFKGSYNIVEEILDYICIGDLDMLNKLASIANNLDDLGMYDEANEVTSVMKRLSGLFDKEEDVDYLAMAHALNNIARSEDWQTFKENYYVDGQFKAQQLARELEQVKARSLSEAEEMLRSEE